MSDIKVYNNTNMVAVGGQTPKVSIYKSESHKLHQSFPVNTTITADHIHTGSPVCLQTDGTIVSQLYASLNSLDLPMIGVSVHDSQNPTYKETRQGGGIECTVMVNGYCITIGEASAALQAGYVSVDPGNGAATSDERVKYIQSSTATRFIAIEPATANGLVQIMHI